MTHIVHVQTQIQTVFGLLDDDGNVLPQQPVVVQVQRFAADTFVEAHDAIAKARDDAAANMETTPPPAAENGNRAQRRAAARKKPAALAD